LAIFEKIGRMKKTRLHDGTEIYCLRKPEAKMLDHHVEGYLKHGVQINDHDVVMDVGANVGVFSLRAAQKGKNVKVYAFEPIPSIFNVLSRNAHAFHEGQINAFKLGISDHNGQARFTYFPNTPALSTSHPEQWDNNPGAFKDAVKGTMKNPPMGMKWMRLIPPAFAGIIANFLVKGKEEVQCDLKTLSTFIREQNITKIDLLKIDCEGAEWSVIQGIEEAYWPMIKSLVIEVHDLNGRKDQVCELLKNKGFTQIHSERESGLEQTPMYNIFALRS
jgi:31-O-methyltransferase